MCWLVAAARGARVQVHAGRPGGAPVRALGGGPALAPARRAARHRLHRRGRARDPREPRDPRQPHRDHHILDAHADTRT